MYKVNYDATTGDIKGFYPDDIAYGSIPSPTIEIDEKTHLDCINNPGLRKVDISTLKIVTMSNSYCYYNYGLSSKIVNGLYTATTGEVLFFSAPTTDQLAAAFPTIASTRTFTVTTNAASGDTITMFSTTVTLGTDITVGSTVADTVTNLVNYMNAQERLLGNYRLTGSGDTFTLTERFAGGGFDIPVPTTTGTIVISAGKLTESVWGYTTQLKHNAKVALEASAETILEEYRKNYIGSMATGNTTLATSILADISSLNASLYTAIQKINDEE